MHQSLWSHHSAWAASSALQLLQESFVKGAAKAAAKVALALPIRQRNAWTPTCRACLSRRSEYYHAMLHSPFQEGRATGSTPVTTAQVADVSPEVLEAALLWMYTDNIPAAVEESGDLLLQVGVITEAACKLLCCSIH